MKLERETEWMGGGEGGFYSGQWMIDPINESGQGEIQWRKGGDRSFISSSPLSSLRLRWIPSAP